MLTRFSFVGAHPQSFSANLFRTFSLFLEFSGRFDTSGSMIARSVPEIHCTRGDPDFRDEDQEELGILVVGLTQLNKYTEMP